MGFMMDIYGKQVVTRNGVTDTRKLDDLIMDMELHGWSGRPVIVADMGEWIQAFTGSHRIVAADMTGTEPEVVWLPSTLTEEDWEEIQFANDDHDLLKVFEDLWYEYPRMADAVAVMRQEVDSNNKGE
nr:MAG TPA: hypothetical protein [Caudoviricetes sp.]